MQQMRTEVVRRRVSVSLSQTFKTARDIMLRRWASAQVQPRQDDPADAIAATEKNGDYVAKNAFRDIIPSCGGRENLEGLSHRAIRITMPSLQCYLIVVGCSLLALPMRAAEVTDVSQSPAAKVHAIGVDEVRWTEGFWADRYATLRDRSLPAMTTLMRGHEYKPYYENFLIAAGDMQGDYHGAPFNDGDYYKFLEAVTAVWAVNHDPELKKILNTSIDAIARAQRSDGYIHTPVLVDLRNGKDAKPFSDRANFEMYNMGHLLTAACLHHRATGEDTFLNVAKETADFLAKAFANPTPELARNSVCPSHYMGLVELYRTTHDKRHLQLAQKFLAMRNLVADGGDDNQDRIPFLEQREAVGHAVRANYLYAGATDLLLETGDNRLLAPLEACWQSLVDKKLYVTGGCGALYDGASPDASDDQGSITRTHQAYGRNYQLPNTTAYNETCATIGSVLWNWRMFLATGEAKYIDVLELALYNSVLSGVSLEGTDYFYVNPLRLTDPLPTKLRWSRERVPFVTSYCCPPNVLRTIAEISGYAYAKTDDAIYVNLYGGSKLNTSLDASPENAGAGVASSLILTQTTRYPWDGVAMITIDACPNREFAIRLRIPGWAESATISVNGKAANVTPTHGTYAEIHREWRAGDAIELDIPMPAVKLEANPLVEETLNQTAIKRGPLVYCLESPDLPEGMRISDVTVSPAAEFRHRHDDSLLGGVTVLEGPLAAQSAAAWDHSLYRPLTPKARRELQGRLIPYYAWSNRGKSEMSVWLPLAN
jgi:DUF1680 family protein